MIQWKLVAFGVLSVSLCVVLGCNRSEEPKTTQPTKPDVSLADREGAASESLSREKDPFRKWETPVRGSGREPGERRARSLRGKKEFSQRLRLVKPIESLKVGQTIKIQVVVKNTSNKPWPKAVTASGEQPVLLWYHWLDGAWRNIRAQTSDTPAPEAQARGGSPDSRPKKIWRPLPKSTSRLSQMGKVLEFGGLRTSLPRDLAPGEEVTLDASIKAPAKPGEAVLRLTMFKEGGDSFENLGGRPLDIPLLVTAQ